MQKAKTEEQVRGEFIELASKMASCAENAPTAAEAQAYAESAAALFSAAKMLRPRAEGDPSPTGG
jgi:hypothetical protein